MEFKNLITSYWWIIVVALVGLVIIAFIIGNVYMNRKIAKEVELLSEASEEINEKPAVKIQEYDLEGLPKPVEKWLKSIGIVGQERIRALSFSQHGKMKLKPDQDNWMDAEAKQYVRVDEPGYLWHVDLPVIPVLNTKGRDLFYDGEGAMEIRIGSLIPVVNEKSSDKLNESSLHRFLLELPWYPTAALEDYMTWEEIDKQTAKGILSYKGITVEAIFYFDEEGNLIKQESLRYKENDDESERIPCIGEIKGHIIVDGLKIANRAEVTWVMDGEPFTWYKLENFDISIKR